VSARRSIVRSERFAAVVLLGAAVLGLVLANTPLSETLIGAKHAELAVPWLGLSLDAGQWVSDGLLAVFFFVAAVELKHELLVGELNSPARALRPAIAAAGGVIVPAVLYLAFTHGSGQEQGWPIPTATDVAFALGVLAIAGRGMPARVRIFLLALAIVDDIAAIVIIAIFFAHEPQLLPLALAVAAAIFFALLSRLLGGRWKAPVVIAMILLALAVWVLVALSGVHPTIAGVLLGLGMAHGPGLRTRHALEPVVNGGVLPLFAFSAALVAIPAVPPSALSPAFWAIIVALPLGKFLGIGIGGLLARLAGRRSAGPKIALGDILAVAALGGVGFTVSLLMNELAFARDHLLRDEGTLAVLLGSGIAIVAAAIIVAFRARGYRRLRALRKEALARRAS